MQPRTTPSLGPLYGVLVAIVLAYAALQGVVAPVLPVLQRDFDTDQATVTWVLTAYLLSASVCTPILGRAGDLLGKRRVLLIALAALVVGCAVAALAPSIGVLIAARVLQGAGGAVLPLAFGIIRDVFPSDRVSGKVGAIAALSAVGAGAGSVLAGPVLSGLGVRWLFWLPMLFLIGAAVAAWVYVPATPVSGAGRVNVGAALLLSGWLVCLLLGVSRGGIWGWTSGRVLGLLVAAVLVAAAWVVFESRSKDPLIDMQMLRLRPVWTTNLAALLFGGGMYGLMAFLPAFVQTPRAVGYGFDATVTQSALFGLPQAAVMFVVGMASAPIGRRIGPRVALIAGAFTSAAGLLLLAVAHAQAWQVYLATGVMGAGLGLSFAAMAMVIVNAVPKSQTGVASGMNANIRTIGGSLGAAVMAGVVTSQVSAAGIPLERGYTIGFLLLAALTALAGVAGLLIPRSAPEHAPSSEHPVPHAELALVAAGTLVDDAETAGRE